MAPGTVRMFMRMSVFMNMVMRMIVMIMIVMMMMFVIVIVIVTVGMRVTGAAQALVEHPAANRDDGQPRDGA